MGIAAQNGLRKRELMSRYFNDELTHYGMPRRSGRYKWGSGERPYQSGGAPALAASVGNLFQPTIQTGKGKANQSAAERTLGEANKSIESIKNTSRQIHDTSKKNRPSSKQIQEVKNMSDEELRQIINRKNLERQYYDLTKDPATNDGYNKLMNVLSVVGTVATIAAAGATVYSSIRLANQNKAGDD